MITTKRFRILSLVSALALAGAGAAFIATQGQGEQRPALVGHAASFDTYLKLGDVKGESSDAKHKDAIEVQSFSWGAAQGRDAASGLPTGKVKFSDLMVTKAIDAASPKLFLAAASGKHYPEAVLTVRKPGASQDYLKIQLQDVLISSYQVGGDTTPGGGRGTVPSESVSINFAKITFEYTPQKADGTLGTPVTGGWDLKTNKAF